MTAEEIAAGARIDQAGEQIEEAACAESGGAPQGA